MDGKLNEADECFAAAHLASTITVSRDRNTERAAEACKEEAEAVVED